MNPLTVTKARTMTVTQLDFSKLADSKKLTVLTNVVLLVGLLVLIISIQIVSGF